MKGLRNTNFCIISSFLPKIVANLIDLNKGLYTELNKLYRREMKRYKFFSCFFLSSKNCREPNRFE